MSSKLKDFYRAGQRITREMEKQGAFDKAFSLNAILGETPEIF